MSPWFQGILLKLSSYGKKNDYSYVTEGQIETQNDKPKSLLKNK